MSAHKTRFGSLVAALALAALPTVAAAAPYVPPGNSAANQYTEAVPTAGGPKATDKGKQGKVRSPSKILGSRNAQKLDAQGPDGQAAAEVAAATAPATTQAPSSQSVRRSAQQGSAQAGGRGSTTAKPTGDEPGGNGARHAAAQTKNPSESQSSNGSSGLSEVIGQATGSSSGQLGPLLPLLIAAVVIWSATYLLRQQRKRPAE